MPAAAPGRAGRPRGLYLVTPDEPDTGRLLARVAPLLEHATWLQYRNKAASAALRREQVERLQALCAAASVPLVVNDAPVLAAAVGAAGVHLGEGDAAIAAAIDLLLAVYDYGAPYYDNWLQMRVMSAIFCANARRVTLDPVLAQRYADEETVMPDDLQIPVSGRAIARAMNLPYSTVRRQIEVTLRRGWIVRRSGGLIRSRTHQIAPEAQHVNRVASLRVLKMFESLASAGFRFRDPASHYHDGPPRLLDFS